MEERRFVYKSPNHAVNLNNMRLSNKWCDLTIKVEEKEFRAHKYILAANLKYFETMLSGESFQESKQDVISMEGVKEADLEAFISYAYTGEILLTESNALDLLELANYLSEDGIEIACIDFLQQHLRKEQACRAYKLANNVNCLSMKKAAKRIILLNFEDCSQTSDYLKFYYEHLTGIFSDGKEESAELQQRFFEGIVRWIMHDVQERKIHLDDLLSTIDIAKLKADYLIDHLYGNVVDRNDEYGIAKDIMFCYQTNKYQQKKRQALMVVQINCKSVSFQFCDITERKWSPLIEMKCSFSCIHLVYIGAFLKDEFYYINEYSNELHLNVWNPTTGRNSTIASSRNMLSGCVMGTCGTFLYLCGGKIDDEASNQLLRYDPLRQALETLTPMSISRSYGAAIFYRSFLFVIGGNKNSLAVDSVEKYRPNTDTWFDVPSMCEARSCHAVAVLDGTLYACGGYNSESDESKSSVEVYDPISNNWRLVASMNKHRSCFSVVTHKGKLIAIGGDDENTVEVYDPVKDEWLMDEELSAGLVVNFPGGGFVARSSIANAY